MSDKVKGRWTFWPEDLVPQFLSAIAFPAVPFNLVTDRRSIPSRTPEIIVFHGRPNPG